MNETKHKNVMT